MNNFRGKKGEEVVEHIIRSISGGKKGGKGKAAINFRTKKERGQKGVIGAKEFQW